ncbi:hypothetical protein JYU34_014890 [Plutella xylostella]|uniref:MYND-type domain-containing protein n=1 Tax=Plutella xylostella TaxID=51655 RepID=A0ABQ7Q5T7_PLUXY|nr:hypothetical protein JYU34_014890 [Plutella xylostella]
MSSPFYDAPLPTTNGSHEPEYPHAKRPAPALFLNPPFLYPLPSNATLFDYGQYHPYHAAQAEGFDRRDGGISVRDVSSMNASFGDARPSLLKTDDEWRNINTMLNCILSMVEKTKRALAILQQRGAEPADSCDIKRAAAEIMAAAVRQTEDRVADVRRRAEDAVNQVKRQALVELQRAVGAAEAKALELVAAERGKQERLHDRPEPGPELSPGNNQQNCCWNCGRKAQETCSGCNAARYCGAFCQHKDWENHHQVCSGRDQKPSALLTTSPPATTSLGKTLTRSTTPLPGTISDRHPAPGDRHPANAERHPPVPDRIPANQVAAASERLPLPTNDSRLSLSTLNTAERMLSNTQERTLSSTNSERIALASLSSAQGMIGGVGGKK